MMRKIKEGDLLYICSIDRLGRNYLEIQNEWQKITKEKKVDIVVIDMPLLDTRIGKDLLNTFIADLVFQILSFIAENERDTIKRRQREGIEAAKLRGVVFGRPRKKIPNNFLDIISDMKKGKIKKTEAAKLCNVGLTTFYKLLKQCDF